MKSKLAVKAAAVILSYIMALICAASAISVVFMEAEGFYVKSLDEINADFYDIKLYNYAEMIYDAYVNDNDITEICEANSIYCKITDSDTGELLFDNTVGQEPTYSDTHKGFELYGEIYGETSGDEAVYVTGVIRRIDIEVESFENLTSESSSLGYYTRARMKLFELGYKYRYTLIISAAASALIFVCLIVFLCAAAGQRPDGSLAANFLDRVPFDLLLVLSCGFIMLSIIIVSDTYAGVVPTVALGGLFFSADYFILLALLLSFATRVKTKALLKNNIIYRIVNALLCAFKKLLRFIGYCLARLSLAKKTVLICVSVACFDFFATLFCLSVGGNGLLILLFLFNAVAIGTFVIFTAVQLGQIKNGGEKIANGDMAYKIDTTYMYPDFQEFCASLNNISRGMQNAVDEKMKSERMRTELITNVSHDIKTPLTSIINYVDLIKKEGSGNEKINEYISVLDRQSVRLKKLIEDLVEASKAATGNLKVNLSVCEPSVLLTQTAGEFDEAFAAAGLTPILKIPEEPIKIMADGRHLWRVFENLTGNICKYSKSGTRVYMELVKKDGRAEISFKNISEYELDISPEELTERFVRGDKARSGEGSGLGLSIAKSLTELQNGEMKIETDGDLFKVILRFDTV